jgi:hypothetical protein
LAVVFLVGPSAGLLMGAALAQPGPPAAPPAADGTPDKDLQAAKQEFEEAQTLFIREKFEDAAQKFQAAYSKKPFPAFLFNVAVSYEKALQLEKASEYFQKYLDKDPGAADAATVKSRIEALRTILAPTTPVAGTTPDADGGAAVGPDGGAVAVAAPPRNTSLLPAIETKGLVVIDSKPQGATIYLDNKKAGAFARTPWQGSLPSKPVKLLLEAKGFKAEERAVSPRSDKLLDVYIALSEEHFLGWVEIVSNVPGADVFIDQREVGAIGRTPFTGHLKPGKHIIFVEKAGYRPARQDIDVLPGTATQHSVRLEQGDNGWVSVAGRGTYGAKMTVDRKTSCNAPCRIEVAPGMHQVLVEKSGFEDYESELKVDKVAETVVEVQWSPRPPKRAAWTTAALAAVFLGAGIYVGHLSSQNLDGIKSDANNGLHVDSADPRYTRGKWEAIGADALFGVALILAISSTVSFLSHGPESTGAVDQRNVSLAPTLAPGGLGLGAQGRF